MAIFDWLRALWKNPKIIEGKGWKNYNRENSGHKRCCQSTAWTATDCNADRSCQKEDEILYGGLDEPLDELSEDLDEGSKLDKID